MDKRRFSTRASDGLPSPARTERRRIPVGVEKLLYLAAEDPEFAARLADDRRSAIGSSGIFLTPTESALLANIPDAALTQMIAGISPPDHERRTFMTKVAGAVALLSAGSACDGVDGEDIDGGGDIDAEIRDVYGVDAEIRDVIGADGCRPPEASLWDAGPEAGLDASVQSDGALDAAATDATVPDGNVPDAQ